MPRVLELTGPQQRQLKEALVDAYESFPELSMMVLFQLNEKLAAITGAANGLHTNVFDLISWASARGMLGDLIVAARNERPRNPKLSALAATLSLSSAPESVLQKIVNDNALLLNVEVWREGQARAEWRVCRIDVAGEGIGTGFLVGQDLVLTNYHVVESLVNEPKTAKLWRCRFDHRVAADGVELIPGRTVALSSNWLVDHSNYSAYDLVPDPKGGEASPDELDFALLRLGEPIGELPVGANAQAEKRGWFKLASAPMQVDGRRMVAILQHPSGLPMKLAFGMVERLELNAKSTRVRHGVPTQPGSSGSPLFDQDWNVIAIHHAGDPKTVKPEYNEAIPIGLIALRTKVAAALES